MDINYNFLGRIKLILYLMGVEDTVKDTPSNKEEVAEKEYQRLEETTKSAKDSAPKPSFTSRARSFGRNVANVAKNAFDNTAGLGVAKYQNYKTAKEMKKGADGKVVYLMHGVAQNQGSQWRLAKELQKEGYKPYHLKAKHRKPRKEIADDAFGQIDKFHNKAGIEEAVNRADHFSGHSSGGDIGIYMAGDDRMKKYGIKSVQARAPAPYGVKPKTLGQKALIPALASHDNLSTPAGKRNAVEMDGRKPKVPVQIYAGKNDQLVRPKDAYWKHANNIYVVDHPDSTHFGTSGANKTMNKHFVKELSRKHKSRPATEGAKLEYEVQEAYQTAA